MQRIYGAWAARLVTGLVIVTAFASVFSLMLGYSRVPYAAAKDGNYFKAFAKVHPVHRFPHVSLLALGVVAAAFCFLRLKDAIAALVVIRLILQFLVQAVGVIILRITRPEMPGRFACGCIRCRPSSRAPGFFSSCSSGRTGKRKCGMQRSFC